MDKAMLRGVLMLKKGILVEEFLEDSLKSQHTVMIRLRTQHFLSVPLK